MDDRAAQTEAAEKAGREASEENAQLADRLEQLTKEAVEVKAEKTALRAKVDQHAKTMKNMKKHSEILEVNKKTMEVKLAQLQREKESLEALRADSIKTVQMAHARAVQVMNDEFEKMQSENRALKERLSSVGAANGNVGKASKEQVEKLKHLLQNARAQIHGLNFQLTHGTTSLQSDPLQYEEKEAVSNVLKVCLRKISVPESHQAAVLKQWTSELGSFVPSPLLLLHSLSSSPSLISLLPRYSHSGGAYCGTTARLRDLVTSSSWSAVQLDSNLPRSRMVKAVIESILTKRRLVFLSSFLLPSSSLSASFLSPYLLTCRTLLTPDGRQKA